MRSFYEKRVSRTMTTYEFRVRSYVLFVALHRRLDGCILTTTTELWKSGDCCVFHVTLSSDLVGRRRR